MENWLKCLWPNCLNHALDHPPLVHAVTVRKVEKIDLREFVF